MSDPFFSRWSRRKQGLDQEGSPSTAGKNPTASLPLVGARALEPLSGQPTHDETANAAVSPVPPVQPPMPTLDDVQDLTPASDFQTFMREGVPGEVRNAAMKKLFTDPHFNVMDGLDIYIGDYNTPDPLPAGMLEKMVGAELLGMFSHKPHGVPIEADHPRTQENPRQSLEAAQCPPTVAKSPPSPTTPALQTPSALQVCEPIQHDHPDLQLQPNHASASPSLGPRTG
jgi:Protein of unknown function (DUF3306)